MGILDGAPYVVNAAIVQSIQGAQGGSSLHVPPRQCAGTGMLHDFQSRYGLERIMYYI